MTRASSTKPETDATVALLSVALDRGASEPLVRQLYSHLRELILTQRLPAGSKLPSTRKLSRDLQVSRTVTLDAFAQLAAEGFIESRRGAGHFATSLPLPERTDAPRAARCTDNGAEASIYSVTGRPFDPAWQGTDLFSAPIWSRMLGRGWRRNHAQSLERHWAGLPDLREAIARHLHALRGIARTADEIMITSGNSDVMALIARMVGSNGQGSASAWVEEPGLGTARQILNREGVTTIGVPVDGEGIDVAAGERLAPDAVLALTTPTRQFPLGMPLSLPRRLSLLAWARRSGAIVVDDDYDSEIRFAGRPLQSLASLDPAAQVLTLGSFSKLTFAGLRLGYAAGPSDLIAKLVAGRRDTYALVPTNVQAAFAEFITTGAFARHLRQLRTTLTRRRGVLVDGLRREAGDLVEILPQEVGMQLTVRLSDSVALKVADVVLAEKARGLGLVLLPLSQQYVGAAREQGFLLGYAGWTEAALGEAVDQFAKLLRIAA